MVGTFYGGHDKLYHHAKFGEIEQRTPAVGLKIWCFYVCYQQFTVKWQTAGIKNTYSQAGFILVRVVRVKTKSTGKLRIFKMGDG